MTGSTSTRPIRIMLVDDHPVLRAGLANLLGMEAGLVVVAQAGSGEAAVRLCRQHHPDICLLDFNLPGMGGLEAAKRLQAVASGCRIVVLTSSESSQDAERALAGGAHAFVTKTVPLPDLVDTIHRIHQGDSGVCRGVERGLSPSTITLLSPREHSVLLLLRRGLSNPDIGRALGITERTVKWHVRAILEKLGVTDRTAAVARAFDLGLLRPGTTEPTPNHT